MGKRSSWYVGLSFHLLQVLRAHRHSIFGLAKEASELSALVSSLHSAAILLALLHVGDQYRHLLHSYELHRSRSHVLLLLLSSSGQATMVVIICYNHPAFTDGCWHSGC